MPAEIKILGLTNLQVGFAALPVTLSVAEQVALEESLKLVEADAKSRTRGRLASSIQSKISGPSGSVGTDLDYGPFVEGGTAPHEIAPVTALALLTPIGIYASVQHPGTPPRPFLQPALDENRLKILAIFQAAAQKALALIRGV